MNVLESLVGNQSSAIVSQLAKQLGVGEDQARAAAGQLIPALTRGIQNNASTDNGLTGLIGALQKGNPKTSVVTLPTMARIRPDCLLH